MGEAEITYFLFCYLQKTNPMEVLRCSPQSKGIESIHADPSGAPVGSGGKGTTIAEMTYPVKTDDITRDKTELTTDLTLFVTRGRECGVMLRWRCPSIRSRDIGIAIGGVTF